MFHMKTFLSEFASFVKETRFLSLKTLRECMKFLEMASQTFTKMALEIEKPTCKREENEISNYLRYSALFLGLLNCISSCLFHLGEARLRLLSGLGLLESSPADALTWLKPIKLKHVEEESDDVVEEVAVLAEVGSVWLWGCYTILGALSGNSMKWEKKRRRVRLFSGLGNDHAWEVKEIIEINEAVIELKSKVEEGKDGINEAHKVQRMVEVFGTELDSLEKEVGKLFFEILGFRDKLLDGIRVGLNNEP